MAKKKKNTRNSGFLVILTIGVVIVLILVYAIRLSNQSQAVEAISLDGPARMVETTEDVPRVSLKDAKKAIDEGQALVIDVRSKDTFEISHIPGSLLVQPPDIEQTASNLDPNELIFLYCT